MENRIIWHLTNVIRHPFAISWYIKKLMKKLMTRKSNNQVGTNAITKIVELDTWFSKNLFSGMIPLQDSRVIDWIIPDFSEYSGGHKTISRMCKGLEMKGISSRFLLLNSFTDSDFNFQSKIIKDIFDLEKFSVNSIRNVERFARVSIATSWESSFVQYNYPSPEKFYFVQDAEHHFYSASSESALALMSYGFPTKKIVLGKWLTKQIEQIGSTPEFSLDFGVTSKDLYPNLSSEGSRRTIIIYCQPSKPRRGSPLIFQLLTQAAKDFSKFDILVLGENFSSEIQFANNVKILGAVSEPQMLSLFRPGSIGVVISHSNPSLVAFEMLNRGMIVCTNGEWSNKMDLTNGPIEFFAPLPSEAILAIKRAIATESSETLEQVDDFSARDWGTIAESFGEYFSNKLVQ